MKLLLEEIYSAEGLTDIQEDIECVIDDDSIPVDEHGFQKGRFKLTLEWIE